MYHQLLKRAVGRGSRQFDFGRSSEGSGTWRFKQQWGAMPQATVWQTLSREAQPVALRPDNPKFQRRIETWQKLPVWVTVRLGPGGGTRDPLSGRELVHRTGQGHQRRTACFDHHG